MIYKNPREVLSEIKHIMDLRDIPVKELTTRLSVPQQAVSKIFGKSNLQPITVIEICNVLNICMDINFIDKNKDDT